MAVIIKRGREKPILNQHPWVFSGAIQRVDGDPQPGDILDVFDQEGIFLAQGYWNPASQIRVRILTWYDEPIDDSWWEQMLKRAIAHRVMHNIIAQEKAIGYRLVNAENDYLPGLIVDRYGDWLVLQALTLGIDKRKTMIAEKIAGILDGIKGIYERSDVDVREREGLEPSTGVLWGEPPPEKIIIHEAPVNLHIDVYNGHKTGFYLDQADNRRVLHDLLTGDFEGECRLLNLFSYTGGFALHALAASGVHAINVDSSLEALELAEQNVGLNDFRSATAEYIQANVFDYLRDMANVGEKYDIVVLDPPKFAHNKRQIERASRGYKDINLNAFRVLKPGGYMMTFSCSGAISADLFQKIVFGALADSGRQAQILKHLSAGQDHPIALTFPEGAYLKGLLLRVY